MVKKILQIVIISAMVGVATGVLLSSFITPSTGAWIGVGTGGALLVFLLIVLKVSGIKKG